jgi:hypothetical protein
MTLEADFLTSAADKLAENLDRIETSLSELPPPSGHAIRKTRMQSATCCCIWKGTSDSGFFAALELDPMNVTAPANFRRATAQVLRCYLQSCVAR